MQTNRFFNYGEDRLTASMALALARKQVAGRISSKVKDDINRSAGYVQSIANGDIAVYGINTGFGPLCTTQITPEETSELQVNLLRSHAVGLGDLIEEEIVRLMLITKVHALSQAFSGVPLSTIERIIWMHENDVIPCVPAQGSVGASGDLAPLSHLFLPLIGEGHVHYNGERREAHTVLAELGVAPVALGPKEGLGLINGTQFIAAHAVKVVEELHTALHAADVCGALMLEGLKGSTSPFTEGLHSVRPHKGNLYVASRFRHWLKGSEIVASHENCGRVQDPYSLRCIPQVHGASRNAWLHLVELVEIEINAVTDNPVIFSEKETISGGNFHGQPLAMALDYACMAAAELGNISDRRSYLALEGNVPGLPKLLMNNLGKNSGFMIPQYTAAAIVSENKTLCHPASVDSIPTSLGQEDHVSMGSIAGRKALQVVRNTIKILGIELFTACQAYDFHRPLKSGPVLNQLYEEVRRHIPHLETDGLLYPHMEKAVSLIADRTLYQLENQLSNSDAFSVEHPFQELFENY